MPDQWYYKLLGAEFGPVPLANLQDLVADGTLSPTDKVRQGSDGQWQRAGDVPQLTSSGTGLDDLLDLAEPVSAPTETEAAATKTASANRETPRWYCRIFGQELGPFTAQDVKKMADTGELSAEDEVRHGKEGSWEAAGTHADWFPGRASPSRPTGTSISSSQAEASAISTPPESSYYGYPPPESPAPSTSDAGSANERAVLAEEPPVLGEEPPAVASETTVSADDEPGWFCLIDDREYGPVDIDTLVRWARERRLARRHKVKMGAHGEWFEAGTVDALFASDKPPAPGKKAPLELKLPDPASYGTQATPASEPDRAEAAPEEVGSGGGGTAATSSSADELLKAMETATFGTATERGESPAAPEASTKAATPPPRTKAGAAGPAPKPVKPSPKKPKPARKSKSGSSAIESALASLLADKKALGLLAGVLLVAGIVFLGPKLFGSNDAEHYTALHALYEKYQELCDKNASSQEWEAFEKRARPIVEPITAELEKTASSRDRAKQELLWASQKVLPMIESRGKEKGTEDNPSNEDWVRKHLGDAREYLSSNNPQLPSVQQNDAG